MEWLVISILVIVGLFLVGYIANEISFRAFSRFCKKQYNRDIKGDKNAK